VNVRAYCFTPLAMQLVSLVLTKAITWNYYCCTIKFSSTYLHCFDAVGWMAGRWAAGMAICLGRNANVHMAQLMPLPLTISCSSKSRLILPFWYQLTQEVLDERLLNGCCCCNQVIDNNMPNSYRKATHHTIWQVG